MIYYVPKHFQIQELIDPITFGMYGGQAWMFFRPELLYSLDAIRDYFDKAVLINNWHESGPFKWRGLRTPASPNWGDYEPHGKGVAVDFDVEGLKAEEVRQEILAHKDGTNFQYIMRMEKGTSWVHCDCFNISDRIRLF
jgi:hypothetical protein